jgi:hypothetical protein
MKPDPPLPGGDHKVAVAISGGGYPATSAVPDHLRHSRLSLGDSDPPCLKTRCNPTAEMRSITNGTWVAAAVDALLPSSLRCGRAGREIRRTATPERSA